MEKKKASRLTREAEGVVPSRGQGRVAGWPAGQRPDGNICRIWTESARDHGWRGAKRHKAMLFEEAESRRERDRAGLLGGATCQEAIQLERPWGLGEAEAGGSARERAGSGGDLLETRRRRRRRRRRRGLGRRPEAAAAAADSEMTDLVPGDGQKKADAPISAEGRRNSSSGSVDLDGAADGSAVVDGRAGLPVQSCFAWLPVELKLKILKSLPALTSRG
ncbi:hypothetical protein NL676_015843 [Syzygium grande]|nr:hypothetical protein NL676_015843 [Syzygium grande]